jgi:hypothetical protein
MKVSVSGRPASAGERVKNTIIEMTMCDMANSQNLSNAFTLYRQRLVQREQAGYMLLQIFLSSLLWRTKLGDCELWHLRILAVVAHAVTPFAFALSTTYG